MILVFLRNLNLVLTANVVGFLSVNFRFECHEDASYAMYRLHQLLVCGKRLVVEYADFSVLPKSKNENIDGQRRCISGYEFTIENISNFLFQNPEFYKKVIQRLNSMSLPSSFPETKECSLVGNSDIEEVEMEEIYKEDSEESELESEDDNHIPLHKELIPNLSELKTKKLTKKRKFNKLKTIPTSSKQPKLTQEIDQVFEKTDLSVGKKMEVKIAYEIPSTTSLHVEETEGFGTFAPPPSTDNNTVVSTDREAEENFEFISSQRLLTNRLKEEGNI